MNNIITMDTISVRIADYDVLKDCSVAFPDGQAVCIVGKAGSGKSTLLKTAAGLIVPLYGSVYYRNKELGRMNRNEELTFRKHCAFTFQDAALWANQSIYSNLSLPLALHENGLSKKITDKRIKAMAERVGYHEGLGQRPASLSAGEQKLISLARSLMLDPELLFMDEPSASLDEDSVDTLVTILKEEKSRGKTLIIVSHDARLIAEIADLLCIVSNGTVSGFGDVEQVSPLLGSDLLKRIKAARIKSSAIDDSPGGT